MSTVVQVTYRPQIPFGLVGMPADGLNAADDSKTVETAAGIGFGLVVTQGAREDGIVVGGAANPIGLTMRDVTLVRSPIDPLSSALAPLDVYPQWSNAAIRQRGHIWVMSTATVNPGDPLYYNTATGALGAAGGQFAAGAVTFSGQPQAGQTVVLNGTTVTFVASGATGLQVNLGPTLGDTLTALANFVNGSADANLTLLTVRADPPSPGGAGQGSGANTLLVSSKAAGVAGNAYTLAAGTAPDTVSGATLAGGAAAGVAIPYAFWLSPAIAGQLARVSLAIQR
jgi:hypothetical protein